MISLPQRFRKINRRLHLGHLLHRPARLARVQLRFAQPWAELRRSKRKGEPMGTVHHLRPPGMPRRLPLPRIPHLDDGVLTVTVTLRGRVAEKVVVAAGMAMKSPDRHLSDLVGWLVLLSPGDRQ